VTTGKTVGNVRCLLPLVFSCTRHDLKMELNGLIDFSFLHSHQWVAEALSIVSFKASLVTDVAFKCLLTETKLTVQVLGGRVVLIFPEWMLLNMPR